MKALAAAIFVLAAPFAVGGWLKLRRVPVAVQWLAGAMAIGALCVTLLALDVSLIAAPVLVVALGALSLRSWRTIRIQTPDQGSKVLALALFTLAALGVTSALARPVADFDALAIWHAKARAFANQVPLADWPQPDYPGLGAILWGLPMWIGGAEAEAIGRSVFALAYVAWIASLSLVVNRPLSTGSAIVIGIVGLAGFEHTSITSGYQDFFLMSVAGVAATMLAADLMAPSAPHVISGALLAGGLGLIKAEGAIYGAILFSLWLAASPARLRAASGWALGGYATLAALWPVTVFAHGIGIRTSWVPASITPELIAGRLDRLPVIVDALTSLRPTYWLPAAVALPLSVLAWTHAPDLRRMIAWLWAVAGAHVGFIIGVFVLTNAPLEWHLTTALSRLAAQHGWIWSLLIVATASRLIAIKEEN